MSSITTDVEREIEKSWGVVYGDPSSFHNFRNAMLIYKKYIKEKECGSITLKKEDISSFAEENNNAENSAASCIPLYTLTIIFDPSFLSKSLEDIKNAYAQCSFFVQKNSNMVKLIINDFMSLTDLIEDHQILFKELQIPQNITTVILTLCSPNSMTDQSGKKSHLENSSIESVASVAKTKSNKRKPEVQGNSNTYTPLHSSKNKQLSKSNKKEKNETEEIQWVESNTVEEFKSQDIIEFSFRNSILNNIVTALSVHKDFSNPLEGIGYCLYGIKIFLDPNHAEFKSNTYVTALVRHIEEDNTVPYSKKLIENSQIIYDIDGDLSEESLLFEDLEQLRVPQKIVEKIKELLAIAKEQKKSLSQSQSDDFGFLSNTNKTRSVPKR